MERNGWTFSTSMQHKPSQYKQSCDLKNKWYGKAKKCNAFAKVTFSGRGTAILTYANCNNKGYVNLVQPDDIEEGISDAGGGGKQSSYAYEFTPKKYIRLTSDCFSVIRLISLELICKYNRYIGG